MVPLCGTLSISNMNLHKTYYPSIFILSLILLIICNFSCSYRKKSMEYNYVGNYKLTKIEELSLKVPRIDWHNVELSLHSDGTFFVSPNNLFSSGYKGRWKYLDFGDMNLIRMKYQNGDVQDVNIEGRNILAFPYPNVVDEYFSVTKLIFKKVEHKGVGQ